MESPLIESSRRIVSGSKPLLIVFPWLAGLLFACASHTGNAPVLTFPHDDASYLSIDGYRALARSVAPAYVKVTVSAPAGARTGRDTGAGSRVVSGASGIMVDPAGLVVTAAHIARSTAFEAEITTMDGSRYPARIVRVEPRRELALLRIESTRDRFPFVPIGHDIRAGEAVLAVGTPGNKPGVVTVGRVLQAHVPGRIQYGDYGFTNAIALAMDVQPGHSGGPVFDVGGALVGMVAGFDLGRKASGGYANTGVAYAVPVRDVMEFARGEVEE